MAPESDYAPNSDLVYDARLLGTKRFQAQQTNWFRIRISGIDSSITMFPESCDIPKQDSEVLQIPLGNSIAYIAGRSTVSDVTMRFYDNINLDTELVLSNWYDQVSRDPVTGKARMAEEYKRTVQIIEYNADDTIQRIWKLTGAFPKSFSSTPFSNANVEVKKVEIVLQCDAAYREK